MTSLEPPLPVPDDDVLDAAASALVDGVATPEEAALVAASPGGAARLAALQAVSEAVGRPGPTQDPAAAASTLAAALAAFDAAGTGQATGGDGPDPDQAAHGPRPSGLANTAVPDLASDGDAPGSASPGNGEDGDGREAADEGRGNVHALTPRRGSPTSVRWLPRLGAVAAALVLLVGIAVLTVDLLGKAGDSGTSTNDVAAGPTSVAAAPPGVAEGGAAMARTDVMPSMLLDGGSFGNETAVEAIALRAAAALDNPPVPGPADALPPTSDLQRCLDAVAATMTNEVLGTLYQAEGTFQGVPALAIAYDRVGDPPRLLLVLARSDCALLERTPF